MSTSSLSFDILGQISPILAWVEGDYGSRLPATWTTETVPFAKRERSWLLSELPTYSYDNVDDIVTGTRADHRDGDPARLRPPRGPRRPSLSPPHDYDLLQGYRHLYYHFFTWNGTELCIRENRMEELHELALRIPTGHVVRHGHARAVTEGVMSFSKALDLPELITLLPSNSFGLRSVVRRGLSESHLHLKGVISAEEDWADTLLKPPSARSIRSRSSEERRLRVLNLFAGRLLALAVWLSLLEPDEEMSVKPKKLLQSLDRIYFARSEYEEHFATKSLDEALASAVSGQRGRSGDGYGADLSDAGAEEARRRKDGPADAESWTRLLINRRSPDHEQYRFLLRWISPAAYRFFHAENRDRLSGSPEDLRERVRFVQQLHLAAHIRLVELTPKEAVDERRGSKGDSMKTRFRDPHRHFLHEALFRYMVCRTHHWQLATQHGRTTGLRYFKEHYDSNQRWPTGLTDQQEAELVFERLQQWRGLRVLEGRVSPPRRPHEIASWILAHARQKEHRIEKFGVVIHFKKEDEAKDDKTFSRRFPSPIPRVRWGRRRRLIRAEGMRLYRILQQPTPVVPFIVGIDACNLELATPPEVFAPLFRFLRQLPIHLAKDTWHYTSYFEIDPVIRAMVENRRLGMTYHVGEDFRHLLSGLRAISEVVEFLAPKPGDRLGHGTALALDPRDWLEHNGYQAVVPKLEWLDTLVWVHHFLGPGDDLVGELNIEDRIQRRSWEIYGHAIAAKYDPLRLGFRDRRSRRQEAGERLDADPSSMSDRLDWNWSPLTLWDAWTLRQLDPYSINLRALVAGELRMRPLSSPCEEERRWHQIQEWVLRDARTTIGSRNAYLLLALYWMSSDVRREGNEIVVIDMARDRTKWLELCRRVEEKMKRKIHEQELVVEVNPSSNRMIGPMDRYGQHHVFNLTLDEEKRLKREVRVSVNTDNPAVCNTTLAHEYYLLGEILIREGVPEAEVIRWLEWLRQNGEDYNFVRRLKRSDDDPSMKKILDWLADIRPTVREARTRHAKLEAFWQWLESTRLRSRGFSRQTLETTDFEALERLVALEARLRELRRSIDRRGEDPGNSSSADSAR